MIEKLQHEPQRNGDAAGAGEQLDLNVAHREPMKRRLAGYAPAKANANQH
ncbi:MAG TPA: hypothetical protein VHD87_14900 [Acidimicrobiales bacterium]|nr:hypothetical protein [Acidimicrobiales bacterium]